MPKTSILHVADSNKKVDAPPNYAEASATASSSSRQDPVFQTIFACVSLNMMDRLRFMRFPQQQLPQIEEAVRRLWPRGIQAIRPYGGSHEVKLRGNPWSGTGWGPDKIQSRALISGLMGELYTMGWVLKCSVDLSKKEKDKDTLLFRYQSPPPPPCDWISISFLGISYLYILGGSKGFCDTLVSALGSIVQRGMEVRGTYEIKLAGGPWLPSGEETVTTRIIALTILEVLEKHGFSLYAAIDQDVGHEGRETDTWHCCRPKNWEPGQPVFHS